MTPPSKRTRKSKAKKPKNEEVQRKPRELISGPVIEKICAFVMAGCTYEIAARAVGIAESTFRNWRRQGEAESARGVTPAESLYVKLVAELSKKEALGEANMVGTIAMTGADGMKWILQRRHPERWQDSQKLRLEMDRRADEFMDALREGLSDAEFSKVLAVLGASGV